MVSGHCVRVEIRDEVIGELWDVVFSALTVSHVLDISDADMYGGLKKTIKKCEHRIEIGYYEKMNREACKT